MKRIFHACCSLLVGATLLSLWRPLPASAQIQNTNRLVFKYKKLFEPASLREIRSVEHPEAVPSHPLLKRYPFLRIRPGQTILKGTKDISGKGQEAKIEAYLLKAGPETFTLQQFGRPEEFVHFDWEVTTENAETLFRGMVREGPDTYETNIVPPQQYNRIKERIKAKYPGSIVNHQPPTIAPPKVVTQSGRVYVHCEALVYIRDGLYSTDSIEGRVENSFVKYTANMGNGFLETEIEVLIKGPHNTLPLYWGEGVNRVPSPSDKKQREAILQEFERMKEFQKFAQDLVEKIEKTDAK